MPKNRKLASGYQTVISYLNTYQPELGDWVFENVQSLDHMTVWVVSRDDTGLIAVNASDTRPLSSLTSLAPVLFRSQQASAHMLSNHTRNLGDYCESDQ